MHNRAENRVSLDNLLHAVLGALGPPVVVEFGLHQGRHDGRGVSTSCTCVAMTVVEQPEPARDSNVKSDTFIIQNDVYTRKAYNLLFIKSQGTLGPSLGYRRHEHS